MQASIIKDLRQAFANTDKIAFPTGKFFYQPEDKINDIYLLHKGKVRQYTVSPSGEEITIHIFKPPSFFPIMLILGNIPNRFYFESITKCTVQALSHDQVLSFLGNNQHVFFDLVSRFSKAIDGMSSRIEQTVFSKARNKIALLFLYFGKSYGKHNSKSVTIDLSLTHEDIASWTGLTRETVSRQISKLKKSGFIKTKKDRFVITNPKKLQHSVEA